MNAKATIDTAGRLVLPKPIRDSLRLRPGDVLEIETQGDKVVLSPLQAKPALQQEQGVWVYRSGMQVDASISDLVDRDRESRLKELLR